MNDFMELFVEFGAMRKMKASDEKVQKQVKKVQDFITEHFYTCSNKILASLGKMYAGGGSITEKIDKAGGMGTAVFVSNAIKIYCKE